MRNDDYKRLVKMIRNSAKNDQRQRDQKLTDGIEEAAELGDLASVWRLARRLAVTGLGPRRRVYRALGASPMTVHDWKEELLNNFGAQEEELEGLVAREGAEQVRDVCKTSRCARDIEKEKNSNARDPKIAV